MSDEFLSRLFWSCSDEQPHYASGLNLGELYERLDEAAQADKAFIAAAGDMSEETVSLLTNLLNVCEKQGFINGFRVCAAMFNDLKKPDRN